MAVSGGWNRPPMPRSEGTEALFNRARALAAHININTSGVRSSVGGASDGNFAAALGRPVLDGLGALGAGAHARTEHATISGMVDRAALSAAILTSLASDAFSDSQEGSAEVVPEIPLNFGGGPVDPLRAFWSSLTLLAVTFLGGSPLRALCGVFGRCSFYQFLTRQNPAWSVTPASMVIH